MLASFLSAPAHEQPKSSSSSWLLAIKDEKASKELEELRALDPVLRRKKQELGRAIDRFEDSRLSFKKATVVIIIILITSPPLHGPRPRQDALAGTAQKPDELGNSPENLLGVPRNK